MLGSIPPLLYLGITYTKGNVMAGFGSGGFGQGRSEGGPSGGGFGSNDSPFGGGNSPFGGGSDGGGGFGGSSGSGGGGSQFGGGPEGGDDDSFSPGDGNEDVLDGTSFDDDDDDGSGTSTKNLVLFGLGLLVLAVAALLVVNALLGKAKEPEAPVPEATSSQGVEANTEGDTADEKSEDVPSDANTKDSSSALSSDWKPVNNLNLSEVKNSSGEIVGKNILKKGSQYLFNVTVRYDGSTKTTVSLPLDEWKDLSSGDSVKVHYSKDESGTNIVQDITK